MSQISLLLHHPEAIPTLAGWFFGEWGHLDEARTVATETERLSARLHADHLPLTLVALIDGAPVGTVSLRAEQVPERREWTPWLAGLYVEPGQRGRGLGGELVAAAEQAARQLGFEAMFLVAYDREAFYHRLGWTTVESVVYHRQTGLILRRSLT